MSSDSVLFRSTLFGAALLALAACGFTPAYGPNGAAQVLQGQVSVAAPDTISGFQLRNRIVDRIGDGGRYALVLDVAESRDPVAVLQSGQTTRFNIIGGVAWVLQDGPGGAVLAEGNTESFTSYAATGSTVATQTAASDARERLMVILADQIVADLVLAVPDIRP